MLIENLLASTLPVQPEKVMLMVALAVPRGAMSAVVMGKEEVTVGWGVQVPVVCVRVRPLSCGATAVPVPLLVNVMVQVRAPLTVPALLTASVSEGAPWKVAVTERGPV